jgi:hypothetical protein
MEDLYQYILKGEIYGNHLLAWGVAVVGALVVYAGLLFVRSTLVRRFDPQGNITHNLPSRIIGTVARATQQFFVVALAIGAIDYALLLPARV